MILESTARARTLWDRKSKSWALSAPFSLAASLMGGRTSSWQWRGTRRRAQRNQLCRGCRYTVRQAFARRGLQAALFDSQASPGLISPRSYRKFVLDPLRGS